jgi:hypothetical protein
LPSSSVSAKLATREHVFESLRKGLVPERGVEAFAVGIEKPARRDPPPARAGQEREGTIKFLRGGYGCGKTFMARLAVLDAQAKGFATSFVVVSDNDLKFHRFDDVYRKVVTELAPRRARAARSATSSTAGSGVEDALIAAGADEDAPDFDARSASASTRTWRDDRRQRPAGLRARVQTIFDLKQKGEVAEAGALISWLSGSGNVAASAKKPRRHQGRHRSRDALDYLRGVLEIVKAAGYKGLVIVIDEAETILRMRKDSRHKSLNGIRQIADAAGQLPRAAVAVHRHARLLRLAPGVAGLAPLHERIRFMKQGNFASLRQPAARARALRRRPPARGGPAPARAVPARAREPHRAKISDEFIDAWSPRSPPASRATSAWCRGSSCASSSNQLDLVEDDPDYDPMTAYGFKPRR